ncbi:hypothetical protein [Glycomyces sp. NPDC048151]|uniref:hypothetical protein n=1 Tax=Glycomyces sp. NPDC048151 TaxID=3364002 RepID=UPI0037204AA3
MTTEPTQPLTGEELDAIQQRTSAHGRGGIYGYVINDIEYQGNWVHDIRLLLAEVDRLKDQRSHARRRYHQLRQELDEAHGEVAFHHSWDGLMALVEQHYPENIFPTIAGPDQRDPGPRIVSLVRWVDRLRAELADRPSRRDLLVTEEMLRQVELNKHKAETALAAVTGERDTLAAALDQFRSFPDNPGPGTWSTSYRMGYGDAGRDVRAIAAALGEDGGSE